MPDSKLVSRSVEPQIISSAKIRKSPFSLFCDIFMVNFYFYDKKECFENCQLNPSFFSFFKIVQT